MLFRSVDNHSSLTFDLNDYLLGGLTAKVRMKSGDLAGFEFEVQKYDHDIFTMFLIPFKDERGDIFPNDTLMIEAGNSYTLVDMDQPTSYVNVAEAELEAAAGTYLSNHSTPMFPYRAIINPDFLEDSGTGAGFEVGDRVTVVDSDYSISGLFRISNLVYDVYKTGYELTLSDTARLTRRQELEIRVRAVERAQEAARKNTAESTIKDNETTNELRNRLLDPLDDKIRVNDKIRNESLDPRMLGYDSGVPQYYLSDALVETNVDSDEDKVKVNTGTISISNDPDATFDRYTISKMRAGGGTYNPVRTWDITETNLELATKSGYWIYAKLNLATGSTSCEILAYDEHKEVKLDIETNYLMYKLGHISAGEE